MKPRQKNTKSSVALACQSVESNTGEPSPQELANDIALNSLGPSIGIVLDRHTDVNSRQHLLIMYCNRLFQDAGRIQDDHIESR